MSRTVPIALELDADARVLTEQRAESFAPGLLMTPTWFNRTREAVQNRLLRNHRILVESWKPEKQGQRPTAPSEADILMAMGIELAIDAHVLAQGYARGEAMMRELAGRTPQEDAKAEEST